MYFILSKILLYILFPLNWIIIFLLIALFTKRPKLKRRLFISGVVLLLLFTNPGIWYLFARNWDIDKVPLAKGKVYSAVIVLGGFSGDDKNGNGYFNESADRFIEGVRLKENGTASHILISGGNGNLVPSGFKEAAWTQGILKEFNLPDSAILVEQNSRNTIENARFSKLILQKARFAPPYLLVTSAWHMRRAQYLFKKEGVDIIPYPSGKVNGNAKLSIADCLIPDADALSKWNFYLKEVVGLMVAHFQK